MRDDNICILHCWLDEFIVRRLHKFVILPQNILYGPTPLSDISPDSPGQPDIVISHYKNFKVHEVSKPLLVKSHDTLEDQKWLALDMFDSFFPIL